MNKEYIVRDSIVIQADSKKVWDALTTPELTKQYFFKSEIHSDWKVGHPLNFTRKIFFIPFSLKGVLEEIEPGKMFAYKLFNAKLFGPPDVNKFSLVEISLSGSGSETIVSISDNVGNYEGAEKRYARSVKGWQTILKGLKELAEKR